MATEKFVLSKKLDHVAFIMDGNGRWAKLRGLPRYLGHKEACNRIIELFEVCREFKIHVMSFYAFSTENWNRPQDEIDHLMDYLEEFFHKEIDYLDSVGTCIRVSGDLSRIRPHTREICYDAINRTKNNTNWVINVCLNYGGRDDIVRASRQIAEDYKAGKIGLNDINEATFPNYLYTAGLPDVDLMIRTSGEERLSNYLLYQNAYAEFVFTPVKWPDFKRDAFIDCLKEFQGRDRRYGGLKNE
jgi:undecaprenyl diphosphate synthase